jgi:hypothetical protein
MIYEGWNTVWYVHAEDEEVAREAARKTDKLVIHAPNHEQELRLLIERGRTTNAQGYRSYETVRDRGNPG